jgi:hypothetical protein
VFEIPVTERSVQPAWDSYPFEDREIWHKVPPTYKPPIGTFSGEIVEDHVEDHVQVHQATARFVAKVPTFVQNARSSSHSPNDQNNRPPWTSNIPTSRR